MQKSRIQIVLALCLFLMPQALFGFDLPGYMTVHGKIIDADTLKPIQGAVVWVQYDSCRPGFGEHSCKDAYVKETLTDAEGEWSITCSSRDDAGFLRTLIGIVIPWTEFRGIHYYKAGYYPILYEVAGICGFYAYPYIDKSRNIEGIVLDRVDTKDEWMNKIFQKNKEGNVTLIPIKDPERMLRELKFNFRYTENVQRFGIGSENDPGITIYHVVGLKPAITPKQKLEAWSLGGNHYLSAMLQPLLTKELYNR